MAGRSGAGAVFAGRKPVSAAIPASDSRVTEIPAIHNIGCSEDDEVVGSVVSIFFSQYPG
jgi:hypothetical protein